MLLLLSSSKKLDKNFTHRLESTQPAFLSETSDLLELLKGYKQAELQKLLGISESLAALNYQRYEDFCFPFTADNAGQAGFLFQGDVYDGLKIKECNDNELAFANDSIRILSGLYGLLRPLDLIQPYRLEMGTSLKNHQGGNLYHFWGEKITYLLNKELEQHNHSAVVNLASNEYAKAVKLDALNSPVITVLFKEQRGDQYKMIMPYVKKARGLMAKYVVQNGLKQPEEMKSFDIEGYSFNSSLSDETTWLFTRTS